MHCDRSMVFGDEWEAVAFRNNNSRVVESAVGREVVREVNIGLGRDTRRSDHKQGHVAEHKSRRKKRRE